MVGIADLPLHKGKVPPWMLKLMEKMSESIIKVIVEIYGPDTLLKGLSDPFWFQAFNNVIGMDWDSSGSTTVLSGILKTITWRNPEIGIIVLGGKGEKAKEVSKEAEKIPNMFNIDPEKITKYSKLAARTDTSFLQDGYELYHHSVIVSESGKMIVIQQGMNLHNKLARRYHIDKFAVENPHSAIAGFISNPILNATLTESREARRAYIDIVSEGPKKIIKLLSEANRMLKGISTIELFLKNYDKPKISERPKKAYYKPIQPSLQLKRALEDLSNFSPNNDIELGLAPGLGPKVLRSLALIADLIYNVPTSTKDSLTHPLDPFAYAYAVGGKDRVPYPYNRKTVEKVILTLEEVVELAKLGKKEKLRAILRLRKLLDKIRYLNS